MNQNEERKTTELEVGQETNTSGSGRRIESNPSSGNSFYERQNKEEKTIWYKDWRGKTLGITLAALILIGGGIPAGMAAAGYWADFKGDQTGIVDNGDIAADKYEAGLDQLAILEDQALMDHYQLMVYEGLVTPKAHDNAIEDASDAADETIKSEKDALKKEYGNTWEEEWDKSLQEKGFHVASDNGEQEYKDSMISDTIRGKITSVYSSKRTLKETLSEDTTVDNVYSSVGNSRQKKIVIRDSYEYPATGENEDYDATNNKYSYTAQDLMTLYLLTYEPIMFNDTLLPFIPVVGNGTEANIQGNNISMTNDDIKAAWSFAKMMPDPDAVPAETYTPAAQNFGGVQSKNSISFSGQSLGEESVIAVLTALNEKTTPASRSVSKSDTNIKSMVDAAFAAAFADSAITSNDVTSNQIINMNDDEVNLFEESIRESLKTAGLLNDPDEDATKYRNWATTGVVTDTVSFVSTNGLHNIGIQWEGSELVTVQLNSDNGVTPGSIVDDGDGDTTNDIINEALDVSLFSNMNTWFSSAFSYITLIDYVTDPKGGTGWFTYDDEGGVDSINLTANANLKANDAEDRNGELTNEELAIVEFSDLAESTFSKKMATYNSGRTFVDTNWKQFDSAKYKETAGAEMINYLSTTNMNKFTSLYFGSLTNMMNPTEKVTNTKRGDE